MWWLFSVAVAADCPEDSLAAVLMNAAAIEVAYATIDELRLATASRILDSSIVCLSVELTTTDALAIHRAKAIASFVQGDREATRASWAAVRAIQPDWTPPEGLMPIGHPLRQLWETSIDLSVAMVELERSPMGGWGVDGGARGVARVPEGRAFLLQGFDKSGVVLHSGYHRTSSDIPELKDMVPTRKVLLGGKDPKRGARIRVWGSVGSGVMAAGAVTCFVMGSEVRQKVNSGETAGDVTRLQVKANALSGAGAGLAAAAVGTGVLVWTMTW